MPPYVAMTVELTITVVQSAVFHDLIDVVEEILAALVLF